MWRSGESFEGSPDFFSRTLPRVAAHDRRLNGIDLWCEHHDEVV
jgi:hypothetical protein